LGKLIANNPDLVFLVKNSVEGGTYISLERFNERLLIEVSQYRMYTKINKELLDEYTQKFPTLVEKHLRWEKGFQGFRWGYFLNSYEKISKLLDNANDYRDLICLPDTSFDETLGFDNEPLEQDS